MTIDEKKIQLWTVRTRAEAAGSGEWVIFSNGRGFLREWIIEAVGRVLKGELDTRQAPPPRRRRDLVDEVDALNYAINFGRGPQLEPEIDFTDVSRFAKFAAQRAAHRKKREQGFNTSSDTWKQRQAGTDADGQDVVPPRDVQKGEPLYCKANGDFAW